jgi:hypothetical protein
MSTVGDVIGDDYSSAYGRMCDKVRQRVSETEYTNIQSMQLKIVSYRVIGTSIRTMNTSGTAVVSIQGEGPMPRLRVKPKAGSEVRSHWRGRESRLRPNRSSRSAVFKRR